MTGPNDTIVEVSVNEDVDLDLSGILEIDDDRRIEVLEAGRDMPTDGGQWTEVDW